MKLLITEPRIHLSSESWFLGEGACFDLLLFYAWRGAATDGLCFKVSQQEFIPVFWLGNFVTLLKHRPGLYFHLSAFGILGTFQTIDYQSQQ